MTFVMKTDLKNLAGPQRLKTAFTFIELCLVVLIISVMASLSVPRLAASYKHFQLESFSRQFQAYLSYLKQRSIVEARVISLRVNKEAGIYSAFLRDGEIETPIGRTYQIPAGIDLRVSPLGSEVASDKDNIFFFPDGQIQDVEIGITSDSGNMVLTTEGTFGTVKVKN